MSAAGSDSTVIVGLLSVIQCGVHESYQSRKEVAAAEGAAQPSSLLKILPDRPQFAS